MSSKVYEATTLVSAAKERVKGYQNLKQDIETLKKAMQGVVDLGDNLEGKGADNIKAFYKGHVDVANQWLNLIDARIAFFSNVHIPMEAEELDGKTVVYEDFLSGELKQANAQSITMVNQQKQALENILNEIHDIVPLTVFSDKVVMDHLHEADQKREKTIKAVESFDDEMTQEYSTMEGFIQTIVASLQELMAATGGNGEVSPMNFDQKAYESSEAHKVQQDMNEQATSYLDYKQDQKKNYEDFKRAEAEANKPWYEKTWDTVVNVTGEVTGYYDYRRAKDGVDPVTNEKLTTSQRATSAAMAAAGFIPFLGWGGRLVKGGSAIYKTAKGMQTANSALKAYKTEKTFEALYQTEKGLYGLTSLNGFSEYVTGKDFLGNELTDEQREMGLSQSLGLFMKVPNGKVTTLNKMKETEKGRKWASPNTGNKEVNKSSEIDLSHPRSKQQSAIQDIESGKTTLQTSKHKGNYGEMKMDEHFENQGFERISNDRVTSIDDKVIKGIDGVYSHAGPPPKYVVGEAKYGTSRLNKTKDGKQMSDSWIEGKNRLERAVGKDLADDILLEGYDRVVVHTKKDGTVVTKALDEKGNVKK